MLSEDDYTLLRILTDSRTTFYLYQPNSADPKCRTTRMLPSTGCLVGGACRDALLGAPISDYDIFFQVQKDWLSWDSGINTKELFVHVLWYVHILSGDKRAIVHFVIAEKALTPAPLDIPSLGENWEYYSSDTHWFDSCGQLINNEDGYPETFASFRRRELNITFKEQSVLEAVKDFDCNLSQVVFHPMHVGHYYSEYPYTEEDARQGSFSFPYKPSWLVTRQTKQILFKYRTRVEYIKKIMDKYAPLGYQWIYENDDECSF